MRSFLLTTAAAAMLFSSALAAETIYLECQSGDPMLCHTVGADQMMMNNPAAAGKVNYGWDVHYEYGNLVDQYGNVVSHGN